MRALVVCVDRCDVELASDDLWSLGVVAVEERDDKSSDQVELWTSLGDECDSVAQAMLALPHAWNWRFEFVDEGVSETWRHFASPSWIEDDFVVYPAWMPLEVPADVVALSIEPGSTFGMGDHPTTVLSLRALRRVITPWARIIDVGCGSGVLAIAACMLGASHADAIDISPAAVPTTNENAARNGVAALVSVSTTPLAEVNGVYDIVLANILAPTLIDLSSHLRRVLAPNGVLIVSGILAERHAHVLDALRPLGQVDRIDLDSWSAITLSH